ncbi:hypothetical protein LINPERHAP2_LOCUS21948 [Linum perenne]
MKYPSLYVTFPWRPDQKAQVFEDVKMSVQSLINCSFEDIEGTISLSIWYPTWLPASTFATFASLPAKVQPISSADAYDDKNVQLFGLIPKFQDLVLSSYPILPFNRRLATVQNPFMGFWSNVRGGSSVQVFNQKMQGQLKLEDAYPGRNDQFDQPVGDEKMVWNTCRAIE